MDAENFVEVSVSITMSTSFYVETKESDTKETIIERAKKDLITPDKITPYYKGLLQRLGIMVQGLPQLKDWNVDELEYTTDYTSE